MADDFDDFNFDDFDMNDMYEDDTDDRSPTGKIRKSAIEKFDELSDDKSLHNRVVNQALPEGFRQAKWEAQDVGDKVNRVYRDAKAEVAPAVKGFKRATNKLLENNKGVLPESLHEKLSKLTETSEESAATTQARMDEDRIGNEIGTMATILSEIQGATAQQQAQANAESNAQSKASHKESILTLNTINTRLDRQIAFSERITSVYYQKNLDLQFRQYFVQRDLLELQKRSNVDIVNNLKAIAKNSSLPDIVKTRNSEHLKSIMESDLYGKITESITDAGRGFKDRAIANVRSKAMEAANGLGQTLDGLTMGVDSMNMMAESGMNEKFDMTSFLTKALIGAGTSKGATFAAKKLQEALLNNPDVALGDAQLKAGMGQLDSFVPYLLSQVEDKGGKLSKAATAMQGFLPQHSTFTNKVGHNLLKKGDEVAPNTVMVNRSITEIIPEFLSLQLHELRVLNGLDRNAPRIVYNVQREAMTTQAQLSNDIMGRLKLDDKANAAKTALDSSVGLTLGSNADNYTKEEKDALAKQFQKMGKSGEYFSTDTITDMSKYDLSDPVTRSAVQKLVNQLRDPKEKVRAERAMAAVSAQARQGHLNIQEDLRGVITGNDKATLRAMGLLYQDENGVDRVDESKLDSSVFGNKELFRKRGETGFNSAPGLSGGLINGNNGPNGGPNGDNGSGDGRLLGMFSDSLDKANQNLNNIHEYLVNNKLGQRVDGSEGPGLLETNNLLTEIRDEMRAGLVINGGSIVTVDAQTLSSLEGGATNTFGQLAGNALSKVKDAATWSTGLVGKLYGGMFTGMKGAATTAYSATSTVWDKVSGSSITAGVTDLYIAGSKRVAITKSALESGTLIDELTGKVITAVEDITGPVKDMNGNYILTAEEFAKGLVGPEGKAMLSSAFSWVKDNPGKWLQNYYGFVWDAASGVYNFTKTALTNLRPIVDVYVSGKPGVALQSIILKNGGYRNASDQSPVNSIDDINGDVEDLQGNLVLLATDLDKLVDKEGNPIKSAKLSSVIGDVIGGALNFGKNALKGSYSAINNAYKRIFGIGDHEGKGILEGLKGFFTSKVSLMRVNADTVIIEGTAIQEGTLERQSGEDPVAYAERVTAAAQMAKAKASAGFSATADKAKSIYDDAATSAYVYADDAKNKIREEINDPEGLIQTTKNKGQSAIDKMTETLESIAASTKETAESAKETVFGDANGDGKRDGNFRDRLAGMKDRLNPFSGSNKGGETENPKEEKESLLSKLFGGLASGLSGLLGGGGLSIIPKLLGGLALFKGLGGLLGGGNSGSPGDGTSLDSVLGGMMGGGGMDASTMAMLGLGSAMVAPTVAGAAVKGTAKGAWALGKGGVKLGGLIGRQGVKGAFTTLTRLPGFAGMLMRAPMMLANPYVLGAVGIAAAGYGVYKAGKFIARRTEVEDVEALRFAHYGFDRNDMDHIVQIRYLEDELSDKISYDDNGTAILNINTEELLMTYASDFGVDVNDPEQMGPLLHWMINRFVPAYRKQWTVLHKLDPKCDLLDIDDELDNGMKPAFAKAIRLQEGGQYYPYSSTISPFPGHRLIPGKVLIDNLESSICSKYMKESLEYNKKETKKAEIRASAIEKGEDPDKAIAAAGLGGKNTNTMVYSGMYGGMGNIQVNRMKLPKAGEVSIEGMKIDVDLIKGTDIETKPLGKLEAMRMHYYGLSDLTGSELRTLRALERKVLPTIKDTIWSSVSSPSVGADEDDMWETFSLLFGWAPKDYAAKRQWLDWYRNRFLVIAVYHQGVLDVRNEGKYRIETIDRDLKGADLVSFLSFFRVKDGNPEEVDSAPFKGKPILTDMTALWKTHIQVQEEAGNGKKLSDPLLKYKNKADTEKDKAKAPSTVNKASTDAERFGVIDADRDGKQPKKKSLSEIQAMLNGKDYRSGGQSFALDNTKQYDGYKAQNGATPEPWTLDDEIETRIKRYSGIIAEASKAYGVPQALIRAIIRQESAGDPNAVSKGVGAMGLMQLMPGTAKDVGVTDAFDPYQNIMGGTKYIGQQLKWANGNVPEALASYNGGRGYVLQAKKQARERLGREPNANEMLAELPNVSYKGKTPDYKQMQDYVHKITPGYASRAGLSLDEVYGGQSAFSVAATKSGKQVPSQNSINDVSRILSGAPSKAKTDTKSPTVATVGTEAAKEVTVRAQEQRRAEERKQNSVNSTSMLQKQLDELVLIRQGIHQLVDFESQSVVKATEVEEREESDKVPSSKPTRRPTAGGYQSKSSSVDMS